MVNTFDYWFMGFFEGEGGCDIHPSVHSNSISGMSFSCVLYVNQVIEENTLEVFNKIKSKLKKYNIDSSLTERDGAKKNHKKYVVLSITGRDDCLTFINYFLPYMLFDNKKRQLEVMRKGILFMTEYKHTTIGGILELMNIIDELRSYRTSRGGRKYTRKYVEQYLKDNPPRERKRDYVPPMTEETLEKIRELRGQGRSMRSIAKELGYSFTSVRNRCKAMGLLKIKK